MAGLADIWSNQGLFGGTNQSLNVKADYPTYSTTVGKTGSIGGVPTNLTNVLGNQQGQVLQASQQGAVNYNTNLQPQAAPTTVGGGGGGVNTQGAYDEIEANYQQLINSLSGQASDITAQGQLNQKEIENAYGQAQGQVGGYRASTAAAQAESQADVGTSTQSAVASARQAFNEIQQRHMSYLSAQGISSSSAAEALQSGLSSETLKTLDAVFTNQDKALKKIAVDKETAATFYDNQLSQIAFSHQQASDQLQLNINTSLRQINENKVLAANQKASARNQIVSQAQAAYANLNAAAQQQAQMVDAWKTGKDTFLNTLGGILQQAGGYKTIDLTDVYNNLKNANNEMYKKLGFGIDISKSLNSFNTGVSSPPAVYYTSGNKKWNPTTQQWENA